MNRIMGLVRSIVWFWFAGASAVVTAEPSRSCGTVQPIPCQETAPSRQRRKLRAVAREPRVNRPRRTPRQRILMSTVMTELSLLEDHPGRRVTHGEAIRATIFTLINQCAESVLDNLTAEERSNILENPKYRKFMERLADDLVQPESAIHEITIDARLERRIRSRIRKCIERLAWYRVR